LIVKEAKKDSMFVVNTTVQTKLLGAQPAQAIDAAVKLLTDNAEKNPNKSIGSLKTLVLASPPPSSLADPLLTLLKHDKDKADRMAHLILSQLSGSYNLGSKFPAISQVLLKNVNGKNLSKKALALRSYGAIVPPGNSACSDQVRNTVVKLMPLYNEAGLLAVGDKKKLSSKEAATIWETNVVFEYALLVARYLVALDPSDSSAVLADLSETKLVDIFVGRLQSTDMPVARHSAALLLEIAKRKPDVVFKSLQNQFSAADSEFGGLFSLSLWRDVLAGTYLMRTFVTIAAHEYSKCVEAATAAAKKEAEEAAALEYNDDDDDEDEEGDDDDNDDDDAKPAKPADHAAEAPLVLKKPLELSPSAILAFAWASRGLLFPAQSVKLFVDTAAAFAQHWDMFCSVQLSSDEGKNAPTLLASAIDRIVSLLSKPASIPCGAKQSILHLVETIGKALVHSKPSISLTTAELDQSWTLLEKLSPSLELISGTKTENAVVRGQALIALLWITRDASEVGLLSPICAALFASSHAVFAEVWKCYEARVHTDSSFAVPLLENTMEIISSRVPLTSVFPLRPFQSAWKTALQCHPLATHRHLVELLRAPYSVGNKSTLQNMKRCACLFIGDHCRALLGMPETETEDNTSESKEKTPTSEPENPALLAIINSLESHVLTGSPITTRKDALEALAKVALTVPESRMHIYEFLTSLDRASLVDGLDDSCGALASLIEGLISYHELVLRDGKPHEAELENLKKQLQSYFNPAVFVL